MERTLEEKSVRCPSIVLVMLCKFASHFQALKTDCLESNGTEQADPRKVGRALILPQGSRP
jgi:hypothetical protein